MNDELEKDLTVRWLRRANSRRAWLPMAEIELANWGVITSWIWSRSNLMSHEICGAFPVWPAVSFVLLPDLPPTASKSTTMVGAGLFSVWVVMRGGEGDLPNGGVGPKGSATCSSHSAALVGSAVVPALV